MNSTFLKVASTIRAFTSNAKILLIVFAILEFAAEKIESEFSPAKG